MTKDQEEIARKLAQTHKKILEFLWGYEASPSNSIILLKCAL